MWRRSSAAFLASSLRATLAARVPAWRMAWPAAKPPIFAVRRTREVGMLSRAINQMLEPLVEPILASAGEGSARRDLRARDDVVRAVGPAHPRLVPAVVVIAEQDQRGRIAHRRARLRPFWIEPAPDTDELVVLELVGDRGGIGVTRMDPRLRRELQQLVHDRALEIGVRGVTGSANAADRAFEQRVSGEHIGAVDQ